MSKAFEKEPRELTDVWNDDERMDFLFSEFPASYEANPENWNAKLHFWTKLITEMFNNSSRVFMDFETVSSWTTRNGRKPLGLRIVWEHMIKQKIITQATEYVGEITRNSSWMGWGVNMFVRKPTIWAAGKMLSPLKSLSPIRSLKTKAITNEPYICVESLQKKCNDLLKLMQTADGNDLDNLNVISFSDLLNQVKDFVFDEKELNLMLLTLEYEKKVAVFTNEVERSREDSTTKISVGKYVKFVKQSEVKVSTVNETDLGVVKLKETKSSLESQIEKAYQEENTLLQCAREHLRKGQRISAKNALRQKQRLYTALKKREVSLDNIHQLLERIHQCKTDKMIMEAYKAGMAAYNEVKTSGLTIGAVDDTMQELNEMLEDFDDISLTLSQPVNENGTDEELEEELNALLNNKEDLCSNQTDADIAKLTSGMGTLEKSTFPDNGSRKIGSSPKKKLAHAV
ncbi:unnamed protein product [Clavelina lepadiformis]|uniref:Charged multivesicular body protein 7 n=1 Tax=Clavelina lepadiformis TaxID=159417 RepID=A0ABP0GAD7_CLALP